MPIQRLGEDLFYDSTAQQYMNGEMEPVQTPAPYVMPQGQMPLPQTPPQAAVPPQAAAPQGAPQTIRDVMTPKMGPMEAEVAKPTPFPQAMKNLAFTGAMAAGPAAGMAGVLKAFPGAAAPGLLPALGR